MKPAFKLYRRKKIYYCEHIESGQQESLHTRDENEATRQLHAKNEAARMGASNMQISRVYMEAADPDMPLRTWQDVIQAVIDSTKGGKPDALEKRGEGPSDVPPLEAGGR